MFGGGGAQIFQIKENQSMVNFIHDTEGIPSECMFSSSFYVLGSLRYRGAIKPVVQFAHVKLIGLIF